MSLFANDFLYIYSMYGSLNDYLYHITAKKSEYYLLEWSGSYPLHLKKHFTEYHGTNVFHWIPNKASMQLKVGYNVHNVFFSQPITANDRGAAKICPTTSIWTSKIHVTIWSNGKYQKYFSEFAILYSFVFISYFIAYFLLLRFEYLKCTNFGEHQIKYSQYWYYSFTAK